MGCGYKDLIVWQKAMSMAKEVYSLVKCLPSEERYALSDQIRRAAVSVPSNIAEGYARKSTKAYLSFLGIASGSCAELETQLILCVELGYLDKERTDKVFKLNSEVGKMITSIIKKLSDPKS